MIPEHRDPARAFVFLGSLLVIWQVLASLELWDPLLFPSPLAVMRSIGDATASGRLPIAIAISVRRLVIGYAISVIAGVILGTALGRSEALRSTVGLLLLGLQALPSICWLPLALLWFGLSETAIFFVVLMGSVLSIAAATEAGVRTVPPLYVRAARSMGAKGFTLYRTVLLPAAFPQIVTGAKLGWSFAWRSLMAAELLYVSGGLGQMLAMGRELHDMSLVIAVMCVIVALGLSVEKLLFGRVEDALRERWGFATAGVT
jgi:NitT/TauT family transport system permease protein